MKIIQNSISSPILGLKIMKTPPRYPLIKDSLAISRASPNFPKIFSSNLV